MILTAEQVAYRRANPDLFEGYEHVLCDSHEELRSILTARNEDVTNLIRANVTLAANLELALRKFEWDCCICHGSTGPEDFCGPGKCVPIRIEQLKSA